MNPIKPGWRRRLFGLTDLAEYYGVSRQLAAKWTRRSDFPEPYDELANGKVWEFDAVTRWARRHDRKPGAGPRKA